MEVIFLSATFWNMRRRMRQQLGIEREVVTEKETTTKPEEKAVTADDNKRNSRKSKVGNSSN